ncbi:MAG: hypothetical protein GVY19_10240 [Bacteroidetes bacterium]|jgi:hypothetical protein|nr:hypothetical protein [Bacteroidota bacterium]
MEIKGSALLAIRDYVKTYHKNDYLKWLNALNDEAKTLYNNAIDSTKWFPVSVYAVEPMKVISNLFHNNDMKRTAWEGGRFSAENALKGIYKFFVKASTPHFIISRAGNIFERYYRPCRMSVTSSEDHRVVLDMTDISDSDEHIEYRIAGWIEKALEISGCKNVTVEITQSIAKGHLSTKFISEWN